MDTASCCKSSDTYFLLDNGDKACDCTGAYICNTGPTSTAYVQSNYACYDAMMGEFQDCINTEPTGVCCTVNMGGGDSTRCMSIDQCEGQNGDYPPLTTTGDGVITTTT
eukprot:CAMPEP_0195510098 /NCGR_PEP_ID=MMETSP0794_2-20130614/2853_1 /TAXON_ID=515487 /ORGANISM="Stephanopyxis turris, Strain CCMP 815" /LENGTH=108 /DNA_ID=CAMNT_0040637463 /DNA_START=26 /DNA_END=349 /DNA_ORIENTATION=+